MGNIRIVLSIIAATVAICACYPNPAVNVLTNGEYNVPLGNHIHTSFGPCFTYVFNHPTEVPLNYELLQKPVSVYYVGISPAKQRGYLRWLFHFKTRYHTDIIWFLQVFPSHVRHIH